jgi:hypothetical protein
MKRETMHKTRSEDAAVSEVVGEMILIGIVLILVSLFSASLADYLPSERSPTVTIRMSSDTLGNLTLWHKGGDWVKTGALRVVVSNATGMITYTAESSPPFILVPDSAASGRSTFDLGGNITVDLGMPPAGDEKVVLSTERAVIFSGRVGGDGP